jgi:hypothetical protein
MPTKTKKLSTVKECIAYVESLGYTFQRRLSHHKYFFRINRPETRPPHNWEMTWSLGEMRRAMIYGC